MARASYLPRPRRRARAARMPSPARSSPGESWADVMTPHAQPFALLVAPKSGVPGFEPPELAPLPELPDDPAAPLDAPGDPPPEPPLDAPPVPPPEPLEALPDAPLDPPPDPLFEPAAPPSGAPLEPPLELERPPELLVEPPDDPPLDPPPELELLLEPPAPASASTPPYS